jgi:hypothetical protein
LLQNRATLRNATRDDRGLVHPEFFWPTEERRQPRRTYISKQRWAFMKKKSAQKEEIDFLTRWKRAYAIAGKLGSPLQIPSITQTRAFARLVVPTLRKLRSDSEDIELAIAAGEFEFQLEGWAEGRAVPSLAERKELISFVAAIASRLEP